MARVWFVRRRGGEWVAPGGVPAYEVPLADIVFPLDIGTHRCVSNERPVPAPEEAAVEPAALQRVFVEVDPDELVGAHGRFPFGTIVRCTNEANHKSVVVQILDRGPYVEGRILDLSEAAGRKIGLLHKGVTRCRVEVLAYPREID